MKTDTYDSLGKYMDLLLDAICVVNREGYFVYVSGGCERIFGYAAEEMIGKKVIDLVYSEDRDITLQTIDEIISGEARLNFENRYLRKDGEIVHIMWSARWSEEEQYRVAVARDITSRKRTEAMQAALYAISEAAHVADDLSALFSNIHSIIGALLPAVNFSIALYDEVRNEVNFPYHIDEHALVTSVPITANSLYSQIIRTGEALLLNDNTELLAQHSDKRFIRRSLLGVPLKSRESTIGALVIRSYVDDSNYTVKDQELLQFVSTQIATAIERKQMIARLQHMALYDQLTQLPNRGLFHDRMQLALSRAKRNHGKFSLFYLDLDKFKEVNDAFGHSAGDILLEKVARRLEMCVRECDTIARFGGDEFVVLLEDIDFPEQTTQFANNICKALGQPFELVGNQVHILPSIGVAHFPLHGSDEKQLLHYADEAMYASKRQKM